MAPNEHPKHLSIPAHHTFVVTCLLLSHGRIISASDDHSIHVYSPATGELLQSLHGHEGGLWTLAVSRDILVSGSTDRTARIWDLNTGRCTHVFEGHTSTVRCLAIVRPEVIDVEGEGGVVTREKWPKQSLVVTGSRDHSLRVWAIPRKGQPEYRWSGADDTDAELTEDVNENPYHKLNLGGHDHAVRALAARGRMPISGSYDCTVRCKWVLVGHTQKCVVLDISRIIACSGSMDCAVRVWNLGNGYGSDRTLKMWNIREGTVAKDLLTDVNAIWQVVFKGRCCIAASNRDNGTMLDIRHFGTSEDDDWDSESPGGIYDNDS
ncbi:hypothetical protein M404DRAFT_16349 [Pisolithus tinctorius Marx 270]|uniref:Uncharacterized protein n=1 Tax=Pisolithus tinctorius Marx 270 TaxID=870435 RepID=A0A0C3IV59_PISTI|nr:hypothetical protein M404DRAFT_16349 [Pisolithus tinctorius Marx 270]